MGEGRRTRRTHADASANQRRVTAAEAAEHLGISEGAVRMRVKRGTLASTREGGRLYVLLDAEPTPEPYRTYNRAHDRTSELIATLREQLEAEREANRENRRIIAALTARIPEIEAPRASESAQERPEEPGSGGVEAQEGYDRPPDTAEFPVRGSLIRPWWRRVFRGS